MDKENVVISEPIFIYGISADNTAIVKVNEERITWPLIDWFKCFWWGIREVKWTV